MALSTFLFQVAQVWVDEDSHATALRWLFPSSLATMVMSLGFTTLFGYLLLRGRSAEDTPDPYRQYVDGAIAMGKLLHEERRDPALLRLRANCSLTLHVWGFHRERVVLGTWALESAQFTHDRLTQASVLIDDLGWANYLLGNEEAVPNIQRAIARLNDLPSESFDPRKSLLIAKAHRHLGVIKTGQSGALVNSEFEQARRVLENIQSQAADEVHIDLTHLAHAEALAITSMLGVNTSGTIRPSDTEGTQLLRRADVLARQAAEAFRNAGDQGRYAKSLVLEVRILEALHEVETARQLAPLRDRAVAASVWSRPDGALFITGR
ncbi:hypothetical protein ACH4E8_17885 [Streptomyces sp. NPDC017979]|uniref:hypothetical protein n=1 Tax=Streptomyces sp. NPDC017979 TaxID=3365024 RepID=UPI00379C5D20